MKYSINKYNYSTKNNMLKSISYNCYDTFCKGRGNSIIKYNIIDENTI